MVFILILMENCLLYDAKHNFSAWLRTGSNIIKESFYVVEACWYIWPPTYSLKLLVFIKYIAHKALYNTKSHLCTLPEETLLYRPVDTQTQNKVSSMASKSIISVALEQVLSHA